MLQRVLLTGYNDTTSKFQLLKIYKKKMSDNLKVSSIANMTVKNTNK